MDIRKLQKEIGVVNRKELLALDPGNDPFWKMAGRMKKAEWAKSLFGEYYKGDALHLRGIHYRMIGQDIEKPWSDEFYLNTDTDWTHLKNAFRDARLWRLIPYEGIDDRKNPTPK